MPNSYTTPTVYLRLQETGPFEYTSAPQGGNHLYAWSPKVWYRKSRLILRLSQRSCGWEAEELPEALR